jgi:hypothetical protein
MITGFVYMVPTHLSTVLFAIASATPEAIAEKLRFVLKFSFAVGIPIMLVLGVGAHLALSIFGSDYARLATVPMWLLLLGYLPAVPKTQYIAVCRATGQVSKAAGILLAQSIVELASVIIGGKMDGLIGVCAALLVVGVLEALMTSPMVIRAATGRLRLPAPAGVADEVAEDVMGGVVSGVLSGAGPAGVATGPLWGTIPVSAYGPDFQRRQHDGLAALIAIATSTKPAETAYDTITDSFAAIREPIAGLAGLSGRRGPVFRPKPSFSPAPGFSAGAADGPGGGDGRHGRKGRHRRTGPIHLDPGATSIDMMAITEDDDRELLRRQETGLDILTTLSRRPPQF